MMEHLSDGNKNAAADSGHQLSTAYGLRHWFRKFRVAFRGLKFGIRGQSSFFVHFFFIALVHVAAIVLRCTWMQWCLLYLCIGLVLTAELFNSAVETLFHGLDENTKQRTWRCLDIASGAVLIASLIAVVVGTIVFVYQIVEMMA